ncbi:MAG: MBL fold metallo-hydrolase, partial [Nitriliruptorales bacterium]|nr:MBL fold metallo-hydrolase [Nitriliruptorales bacterium]
MSARFHLLHTGYARDRVASTVSYVADGDQHIVIDPGMVASADRILDPLEEHGCAPQDVTDVVLSHWHPDHTWHLALFPDARVHDHWAIYQRDRWDSRPAEGAQVSPSVRLLETPGHTP